ncbi:MAG: TonB-dependent receptor plug domain-containing protein, partial [Myxococcota bacterium]
TENDVVRSADLGEVLARSAGVSIQRTGGLGSATVLSLNGLREQQIRLFLDGVPLESAGYPFGLANVPVNLIQGVEVYKGVVPIVFGADALGGAVNLVSRGAEDNGADASYQFGSFNTHRATAMARVASDDSLFFLQATGFYDYSDNDFPITVENDQLTVDRANGDYQSSGARLRVGGGSLPWARVVDATAYYSEANAGVPHNLVMGVPYSDVSTDIAVAGVTLRYGIDSRDDFDFDFLLNVSRERRELLDVSNCISDWTECSSTRLQFGEIQAELTDSFIDTDRVFARATAEWSIDWDHTIRLSVTPDLTLRDGDNRLNDGRDVLESDRRVLSTVGGVEWEGEFYDSRLSTIAFAKGYVQSAQSQEPGLSQTVETRRASTSQGGIGASARWTVVDSLIEKASYEWATRLPSATEYFGDNLFVSANLDLEAERSHNANLQLIGNFEDDSLGAVRIETTGFVRDVSEQIVLFPRTMSSVYRNLLAARSYGLESSVSVRSRNDGVVV